jgi:hypothetical protein
VIGELNHPPAGASPGDHGAGPGTGDHRRRGQRQHRRNRMISPLSRPPATDSGNSSRSQHISGWRFGGIFFRGAGMGSLSDIDNSC